MTPILTSAGESGPTRTAQMFDSWYHADSRVELRSDRLRREASLVLNPLVAPRSVIEVEQ